MADTKIMPDSKMFCKLESFPFVLSPEFDSLSTNRGSFPPFYRTDLKETDLCYVCGKAEAKKKTMSDFRFAHGSYPVWYHCMACAPPSDGHNSPLNRLMVEIGLEMSKSIYVPTTWTDISILTADGQIGRVVGVQAVSILRPFIVISLQPSDNNNIYKTVGIEVVKKLNPNLPELKVSYYSRPPRASPASEPRTLMTPESVATIDKEHPDETLLKRPKANASDASHSCDNEAKSSL
jgi:hypothetical protein